MEAASIHKGSAPVSGVMTAFKSPFWPPLWTAGRVISGRACAADSLASGSPFLPVHLVLWYQMDLACIGALS